MRRLSLVGEKERRDSKASTWSEEPYGLNFYVDDARLEQYV
jgi:hypothetical protein